MPELTQRDWRWLEKLLNIELGAGGRTERLYDKLVAAWPSSPQGLAVKQMVETLGEIAKGEGTYSRDPLEHAYNTVENMKAIAQAAQAAALKAGLA